MDTLPNARPGTAVRILATTDLGAAFVPLRTSYGTAGTCAGVAELLERERESQPTLWLDAGDLAVGPVQPLLGRRPWHELARLPIDAAAAGNHEFDDGVPALRAAAGLLPYPVLCANVDVGLPASTIIDTPGGPVGVIGLTHPFTHRFAGAPPPLDDWPQRVAHLSADLRANDARWVVVLLHDGVDWWPQPGSTATGARTDRLATLTRPWITSVDLVLGGHTPGSWVGALGGVPFGHPHIFAASVLVADLPSGAGRAQIRGVHPVPARQPQRRDQAVDALDAAAANVLGQSRHDWLGRTGAAHYLPGLLARALHQSTGADAGLVLASEHTNQGAVDGSVAALRAGPVTELDLMRLFGQADDRPAVIHLRPGEYRVLRRVVSGIADPANPAGDHVWWNWGRMPPGISTGPVEPRTVAVAPFLVPRLAELLDRTLDSEVANVGARRALLAVLP
ncbi:2',3'-cyclic-nucleotide 2'-phosphodiesterase/5'-or 3'-nucleotidase, 5'-nucleotidase family [Micromonospora coriariae]|uniref:2',3'-cyclic-nucleotide 2'-phosphodiesterase/5'-or 3'-nucleotidase, 5'-nucleotidase family n=1 Tax=Micromonospora coriariae TaxID=285665 RepID=A0A1C4XAL2_9ACTN|nr:metallophosphoesterase [Micromonospora coriariae]SCF05550.1 2',3'-cyclic-nucleotide 2'-phosphodiesterase/5'-or 3'-nucleotidase, 5'-nucleotidase family [Micromonospora coriariae]